MRQQPNLLSFTFTLYLSHLSLVESTNMSTVIDNGVTLNTQTLDSKLLANMRLLQSGISLSAEQQQQLEEVSLSLRAEGAQGLSRQHKRLLDNVLSLEGRELFIAAPEPFLVAQKRLRVVRRLHDLKQVDPSVRLLDITINRHFANGYVGGYHELADLITIFRSRKRTAISRRARGLRFSLPYQPVINASITNRFINASSINGPHLFKRGKRLRTTHTLHISRHSTNWKSSPPVFTSHLCRTSADWSVQSSQTQTTSQSQ